MGFGEDLGPKDVEEGGDEAAEEAEGGVKMMKRL